MGFPPPHFPPPFSTSNDAPMYWPQGGPTENEKQSNYSGFPPFKRPRNFEETPCMDSSFQKQGVMMNQRMMMPPPPQNPNQNPRLGKFFKTRLCQKFQAGHCPYGDNCSYAHGVNDIREPPPNWQKNVASREEDQSISQQSGVTWEDDQKLISKLRLCRRFCNGQECPYGDKCNFVHRHIGTCREESRFRECSSISIGTTGPPGNATTLSRQDQPYGDKHQFAHGPAGLHNYGGHNEVVTGSTPIDSAKFIPNTNDAPNSNSAAVSSKKQVVFAKLLNWDTKKLSRIYADWIEPPRSLTYVES